MCAVVFGHYHAPVIELPYEINAVLGIRLWVGHRYLNTRREEAIFDDGASREGFSTILAPFVCIAQQAEYSGIIDSPLNAVGGYLFLGYSLGKAESKIGNANRKSRSIAASTKVLAGDIRDRPEAS